MLCYLPRKVSLFSDLLIMSIIGNYITERSKAKCQWLTFGARKTPGYLKDWIDTVNSFSLSFLFFISFESLLDSIVFFNNKMNLCFSHLQFSIFISFLIKIKLRLLTLEKFSEQICSICYKKRIEKKWNSVFIISIWVKIFCENKYFFVIC